MNSLKSLQKTRYLRIKVIPQSNKTELVEIMQDAEGEQTIKIKVAAPPEKGKANKELIKFLSKEMEVDKESITIISGKADRLKLIKICQT